jgi:actin-related protein 2
MEMLWEYCFDRKLELGSDKSGKKILLTEPANNPNKNREKMGEIMLEKYGFGGVAFEYQALLTLMAEGNQTGAVLDSGDGVTHVIPVYEGLIQTNQIKRLNVAGRHVTQYLTKLLMLRGYSFNSSADFETVREIKEDLAYVSINIKKERALAKDTTVLDKEYTLPDGQTIIVGRERFEAPEILMNPSLLELEDAGMAEMIYKSITECEMDMQKVLAQNIWLSGGTSMTPGLSSRLEHELKETWVNKKGKGDRSILNRVKIQVHDPPRRKNAVFLGASFFAKFAQDGQYISKAEYQEQGSKAFFRR